MNAPTQPQETTADVDLKSLQRLLSPRSVAIVGASRDEGSVGSLVLRNVLEGEFTGEVYPINPKALEIQGTKAYKKISDCPEVPDLAVVVVPAKVVVKVVEEAGDYGVRAVCVISAGFAEAGEEGKKRAKQLLEVIRRHDMRMIGPNCMGLLNAAADLRLNATFSRTFSEAGRVGMLSQSGALGLAVLQQAQELDLGLSTFVSIGNKLDTTANDLLQYWEQDADTDVVLLYLESLADPREFHRHARRMSRSKPIVVVKSGRTAAGERAASSHTAAVSGADVAADALFAQSGVLRADTLREMFETAQLLVAQDAPQGRRVGIVTNGGGPGILAADACQGHGLEVPTLSESTTKQLTQLLPEEAATSNPVDLLAGADASTYQQAVEIVAGSGEVDVLLVIFIPPIVTGADEVAEAISRTQRSFSQAVPMLTVFMGQRRRPPALRNANIPSYLFPEEAARALGHVARWSEWKNKPPGKLVRPAGIDVDRGRQIVQQTLATRDDQEDELWMTGQQAIDLLKAYGIRLAPCRFVSDADAAAQAQREIDAPVAVKVDAPLHKADVGGIVLNCKTPQQTADAVRQIDRSLQQVGQQKHIGKYLVQEMVGDGVELAVGLRTDPSFGPLLMVGLGGDLLELLNDVSVRMAPTTDLEAQEMMESLKSFPLINGHRNQPRKDQDALLDLMHRLNALAADVENLAELDLNPVFVKTKGVVAADVRLRLNRNA